VGVVEGTVTTMSIICSACVILLRLLLSRKLIHLSAFCVGWNMFFQPVSWFGN
jgi:hypothetical protein